MQSDCRPLILCAALFASASCSTPPPPAPVSAQEVIRRELVVGSSLARQLEPRLTFRRDAEVREYLDRVGRALALSGDAFKGHTTDVFAVQDIGGRWWNFAVPGDRVYLAAGLVRSTEYENELAAMIAVELGHLSGKHVIDRLRRAGGDAPPAGNPLLEGLTLPQPEELPRDIDFFGPSGIFAYSEEQLFEANDVAVGLLYRAGYDPRGLIEIWSRHLREPERTPYEPETLAKLVDRSRRTIALYSPLRNPIVRSEAFLAIQKRLQKL
jgi:predicted Zn-dependent protease